MIETLTDDDLVADTVEALKTADSTSWHVADNFAELARRGWTHQRIAAACGTCQSSVSKFIACVGNYSVVNNRPPFWKAFAEVNSTKAVHVSQNTGQLEWSTPPEYIVAARTVLGDIDLDPASSKIAQQTVRARSFYTAAQDGLSKPWRGRVWLNPPYHAKLIGPFVEKLCQHFSAAEVEAAILLVNNATETEWFQRAGKLATGFCFPNGRLRFFDDAGRSPGSPLQGQAVLYFGKDAELFRSTFGGFGLCGWLGWGDGLFPLTEPPT
jgi:ParB family chromosome partitioning protein